MALVECKECENEISDKAESCPYCGMKQPKKTPLLAWIFIGVIIFAVVMSMIGSNDNSNSSPQKSTTAPPAKEENTAGVLLFVAQQKIRNAAKDPESVQFRGEALHEKTVEGAVACGEYNGKNSFGAYSGFKGFVAVEKTMTLYVEDGVNAKDFAEKWNKLCVK